VVNPGAAAAPETAALPVSTPSSVEEVAQDPPPAPPTPAAHETPTPAGLQAPGRTAYAVVDSPGMTGIRVAVSGVNLVAAALLIAGSLVSWVSIGDGSDTFSANGFDYGYITDWGDSFGKDGIIILVLGLAIGLLGAAQFVVRHGALSVLAAVLGIAAAGVAAYNAIETVSDLNSELDVSTSQAIDSLGAGLYLVIAGGIVAAVNAIVGLIAEHKAE